ncbi:putative PLP-dependent enzyme possibly involved in cell wall biogenesis [Saccharomonospora marina XMU15]|uniref:Putative PLP-dependent enzyme possibly involved in cell wall biogenesis n=1 Tax=Saccharomonospora marina XMU15 TaxID=882083 RepID=H5XBY4_9PSEU|nr:DegT/DnrJ/EryC1/StrS family aminotransferase [Saccharomonospora marina]EHR52771.1 putative PLP-dependent enzyme possibly involved in cell wall biogenesis [Saccharomonospora marina XMU15]
MINIFQPSFGDEELAAVREVLESRWVGKGTKVELFERAWADHIGASAEQVTALSSCTAATFVAMELIEVGPGDEVVLPSVSFVGVANAIAARGARPVFCDVDGRTLNPTVANVAAALTERTKAVAVLHYGGQPGAIAEIAELCRDRGLWLIEDAANAQASSVAGKPAGTFGDIAVWSFDHGKIAVAVEGGMLYARDPALVEKAAKLAYLGLEQRSGFDEARRAATRWWEFDVCSFSPRRIMNDVFAAIGLVQLSRLPEAVARRREIAAEYDRALASVPGLVLAPPVPAGHVTSHYLYWVQLAPSVRDTVARELYDRGIYTTFRYELLHKVPAYGAKVELPGAEYASARTLCLPLHQELSDADVETVTSALHEVVTAEATDAARGVR